MSDSEILNSSTPVTTTETVHKEPPEIGLFSINPGLIIWTWVSFILFFILMKKYAFAPIFKSIQARDKIISDSITDAEKVKVELETTESMRKEILDDTMRQADELLRKYREKGELTANEISKRANSNAERLISQAKDQIVTDKNHALSEFRKECATLVLSLSEKLVVESFDEEKHRQYIEKCLGEL